MQNTVVHFAQTINVNVRNIQSSAEARLKLLGKANETDHFSLLANFLDISPYLVSISWINIHNPTHGSICAQNHSGVFSRCQEESVPNITYKSSWRSIYLEGSFWTSLYKDPKSGKRLISYFLPASNSQHLLKLDLDIRQLILSIIDPSLYSGHGITLNMWKFNMVDNNGDYLYSDSVQANRHGHINLKETGDVYGVDDFGKNIPQLLENDKPYNSRIWLPNPQYQKEYWFFGAPVSSVKWWLYTSVSRQHALKGILELALMDIVIMLISLLLILAGIWYSSKRIIQPLIQLKDCMDQFIHGHQLLALPEAASNDETDSLSRSFIKLTQWLDNRNQELQVARANNMGHIVQGMQGSYFYFQLNKNKDAVYISPSAQAITGFESDDLSRSFTTILNTPQDHSRFNRSFQTIVQGGQTDAFEVDIHHPDGSIKTLEIFWSYFEQGSQPGVIEGLANDVTERVTDTEKFKALLNSAPDAMIIINPDGIIAMANSRALSLFKAKREHLLNMPLALIIPSQDRDSHPLLKALHNKNWHACSLSQHEARAIALAGAPFPAELTSNPLVTREGVLVSVVLRDISERKQIEKDLLTAHDEAVKASRSKSLFLSCMSHELRTPLNGVIGYAQVLQRSKGLNQEQQQKLAILERCGQSLLTLINDILDLTKIESQGVNLHPVPFSIKNLFEEQYLLFAPKAENKSLKLISAIDPSLPEWLEADEVKLRQVLTNLLGNAIKYTETGSIKLSARLSRNQIHFSVSDTGIGIEPDNIETIFDPFQQLDAGLKRGGTGLGLAISRSLVRALGDDLKVSSKPGNGSQFSFHIPIVQTIALKNEQQLSNDNVELVIPEGVVFTVLIVDDIKINRDLLRDIVEDSGFNTVEASNGVEALEILEKQSIDLVLLDIRMPKMDGFEVIARIRQHPSLQLLPVIAVTASTGADFTSQLSKHGFNGSLSKPFRLNHLLQLLSKQLDLECLTHNEASHRSTQLKPAAPQHVDYMRSEIKKAIETGDIESLTSLADYCQLHKLEDYSEHITLLAGTCDLEELEKFYQSLNQNKALN
ncbi:PAS domain-containing hybrid sensor histidine kinase/response regulator [Endozoicomonas sp. OPT23]|uniref:PAS domain-containing hybrid sensor histidine kinase/response regulator n=1 Tax=Endozoicomonas sp. OPT23 TaxID=2072845 RepID=UPI00129BE321|nr:PAS domain-containing hybrid sensor histidine kinase/response regulator [Endozoicomonas sp. OPT23]